MLPWLPSQLTDMLSLERFNVLQQQPRRARVSLLGSLKEPSVSDDGIESQGSSDVDIQSAEEEDDDYEA